MGLRERLSLIRGAAEEVSADAVDSVETERRAAYEHIKQALQHRLIEEIDAARLSTTDSPASRNQIRELLVRLVERSNPPLNTDERIQLIEDLEHETFGLGPLEMLLRDPTIDDILVNGADEVYVDRRGRLERTPVTFRDNAHLIQIIERIVAQAGRRIDESSPMVDARLPNGSRVNAIIPPLAVDGPSLSIRRAKHDPLLMADLLRFGTMSLQMAGLLETAVASKRNILMSGGSGSGKTTLLNALLQYIGTSERVVSIEDTVELNFRGLHVVRLETRPPNIEREGEVTQRDLVRNALRMRPDRIIVGEVRGPEAFDMLQAMNTGHKGSLTTIHANTPRDALARLEMMILMGGGNLTSEGMRRQISSAIDLVIQLHRFPDGTRRIVTISEIAGMDEQIIKLQELAKFVPGKTDGVTGAHGQFLMTGLLPGFFEELKRSGLSIPAHLFAPGSDAPRDA